MLRPSYGDTIRVYTDITGITNKKRALKMLMRHNKEYFSIRKLSIGVASVLIGVSLLGVENHKVYASKKVRSEETRSVSNNQSSEVTTKEVPAPSDLTDAIQKAQAAGMTVIKESSNKIDNDEVSANVDYASETQRIKDATQKYKNDSEKYSKFKNHSQLDSKVAEAMGSTDGMKNHPGLKIVKDDDVVENWKNAPLPDDSTQINRIIDAEHEQDQKLAAWKRSKHSSTDSVMTDSIKQGFWFNEEPDAHLVLNSDNPNVDTNVGISDAVIWSVAGKHYELVLPSTDINGNVVTATYTGLKNSYYEDPSGKRHSISKIVRTFSDYVKNPTDSNGMLDIYTDPNNGYWYWWTKGITITDELFDSDNKPINIGKNAWLLAESLNNVYGNHIEKVTALGDSTAYEIAGSSVKKDGNTLYSPDHNEELHLGTHTITSNGESGWDHRDGKYSYLGSGLIRLNNSGEKTNSYSIRTWTDLKGNNSSPWTWVYFSTKLVSDIPDDDEEIPTTTVHYHHIITNAQAPDSKISYQLISVPDKSSTSSEPGDNPGATLSNHPTNNPGGTQSNLVETPEETPSTKSDIPVDHTSSQENIPTSNTPVGERQGQKTETVKSVKGIESTKETAIPLVGKRIRPKGSNMSQMIMKGLHYQRLVKKLDKKPY